MDRRAASLRIRRVARESSRAVVGAWLLCGASTTVGLSQEPPSHEHEHAAMKAELPPGPTRRQASSRPSERPPATLTVGPGTGLPTIGSALAQSVDGDTIRVREGVYREHLTIRRAVVLRGEPGAVVDGGGRGTVVTVEAPAEVTGLTIRGSGANQSREDSGILVDAADSVKIGNNRLADVLFGIYVKQSAGPRIHGNVINGKDLPIPRRGDGVRLWYCHGGEVTDNQIARARDLVIWFSNGLEVRRNQVSDGRYGLHYMYSDHNVFSGNVFRRNDVGAFIMYSSHIEFRDNRFLEATGSSGMGLGLKDADDIVAENNAFVGNAVGVFLDNSPNKLGSRNRFLHNFLAWNATGVVLLPSVRDNEFRGNVFLRNGTPVAVSGGGDALANSWHGNHWSEYAGFDSNADGIGDTEYRHERLSDDIFSRRPELRLFAHSPAVAALEMLAAVFPLLRPQPVVIDSAPLTEPPSAAMAMAGGEAATAAAPSERRGAAGMFWAMSAAAALVMIRITGTRRRAR